MALKLITPPASEPVDLNIMKDHLRIDSTDEDDLITAFIKAARQYCEKYQNRAYITQTWAMYLDQFPDSPFDIPLPPLQSITHIKYYDTDGQPTTFDSANYQVDIASYKGRIALAYGKAWPSVTLQIMNGVETQFVAGYGNAAANVPDLIIQAIKVLVGDMYEHRESTDIKDHYELPFAVKALLGLDRILPI